MLLGGGIMKTEFNILYCTDLNDFKLDAFLYAVNWSKRLNASLYTLLGMDIDDIERVFSSFQCSHLSRAFDKRQEVLLSEIKEVIDAYSTDIGGSEFQSLGLLERKSLDEIYRKLRNQNCDLLIIDSYRDNTMSEATFKKQLIASCPVTVIVLPDQSR
jgi:hypothetical protein